MLTITKILAVAIFLMIITGPAGAQIFSDEAQLGANVGAMDYCADCCADDDDKAKYGILKLKTLKAYDELGEEAKLKALVFRKKAEEEGDYLGKKLDKERCDSIRKLLYLKY